MSSYSKYEVTFWDDLDCIEFPAWVYAYSEDEAEHKASAKYNHVYECLRVEEIGFLLPQ